MWLPEFPVRMSARTRPFSSSLNSGSSNRRSRTPSASTRADSTLTTRVAMSGSSGMPHPWQNLLDAAFT